MPTGKKKPSAATKKKRADAPANRGGVKSTNRLIAKALNPKTKKKKNETPSQKANRKSNNKARRKAVRKAGKGSRGNAAGNAAKFLH